MRLPTGPIAVFKPDDLLIKHFLHFKDWNRRLITGLLKTNSMTIKDLNKNEFAPSYWPYINKLSPDITLRNSFEVGKEAVSNFFNTIPKEKLDFRYAPDKWSIKEVLQHLIDVERILMHRAFRIARNDMTPLPPFNHEDYIAPSRAKEKSRVLLIEEYQVTRLYSQSILDSLTDEDLMNIGISSLHPMSARAAAFHITGHEIWHCEIIRERYL